MAGAVIYSIITSRKYENYAIKDKNHRHGFWKINDKLIISGKSKARYVLAVGREYGSYI